MSNCEIVQSVHDPRLVLAVVGAEPPSTAEWNCYLETCLRMRATLGTLEGMMGLNVVDANGPSAAQRREYLALLNGEKPRVAVLTTNTVTRAIGTILRLFNPRVLMAEPMRAMEAMKHLGTSITPLDLADELEALATQVPEARTVRTVVYVLRHLAARQRLQHAT